MDDKENDTAVKMNENIKVLVTGGSGFIGIHCINQLLKEGYTVRGTVRDSKNHIKIGPLKQLKGANERLELVEANLENDDGWLQAVDGCRYVLHVASPFPIVADESIISIAVNGTLRVLRAAAKTPSVRKVVITSSVAAVADGYEDKKRTFTEKDWTNLNSKLTQNYAKSKTLAEKAAWDFVQKEVPAMQLGLVDVRDVAQAHIRAMLEPRSDGLRILATYQPSFWFAEIAEILRREFSSQGYTIPRFVVPYPIVWLYSFFSKEAEQTLPRIGKEIHFDNSCAKNILGIEFMNPRESLITMAYDIIERGIIPKQKNYKGPPSTRTF